MNVLQMTISLPDGRSAILSLSQPQTADSLSQLEHAVDDRLRGLSRELGGAGSDPGALEYASWVPQPGPARP